MNNDLTRLHRFILEHYDLDELRTLCFEVGISFDDLGGEGISGKARELLLKAGRQRQFEPLSGVLSRTRPELFRQAGFGTDPASVQRLYQELPTFESDVIIVVALVAGIFIANLLSSDASPEAPEAATTVNDFVGTWFNQDPNAEAGDLFGLNIERVSENRSSMRVLVFHVTGGPSDLGVGEAFLTSGELVSEALFFFDSVNRIETISLSLKPDDKMMAEVKKCVVGQLGPPTCDDLSYELERP